MNTQLHNQNKPFAGATLRKDTVDKPLASGFFIMEHIRKKSHNPNWEICSCGNVFSKLKNRYIKASIDGKGYPIVGEIVLGREKKHRVHRLVAEAFIPNPENKRCVNHINAIRTDNNVENLEWVTHSENCKHTFAIGRRSEKHNRKLSDSDVEFIRSNYISGSQEFGQCAFSRKYNVSQAIIWRVINKKEYYK